MIVTVVNALANKRRLASAECREYIEAEFPSAMSRQISDELLRAARDDRAPDDLNAFLQTVRNPFRVISANRRNARVWQIARGISRSVDERIFPSPLIGPLYLILLHVYST